MNQYDILERIERKILLAILFVLTIYLNLYFKFSLFYTVETFLLGLLYIFIIRPLLRNKLQIRKLVGYSDIGERALTIIITLPILASIFYSVEWVYKCLN